MLNLADKVYFKVKSMAYKFFHEENGEVNIVATVVLIGIAVILAATFKEQITKLIDTLFTRINTRATSIVPEK